MFVKTKSINMAHMEKYHAYFGEARDLYEQLNIVPLMTFNYDFDAELVAQFFATIWYGTNIECTLIWMTNGRQLRTTWGAFMALLGYPDEGLRKPLGLMIEEKVSRISMRWWLSFWRKSNLTIRLRTCEDVAP